MKTILPLCLLAATCAVASAEGKPDHPKHKGPPPEILKKFDKDGNGELSQEERMAMREAMEARHKDKFKEFDTDGDGKLSEQEREKMREARKAEFLKKFDTDGDGKLSEEERKAVPKPDGWGKGKGPHGKGPGGKGPGAGPDGDGPKGPPPPPEVE